MMVNETMSGLVLLTENALAMPTVPNATTSDADKIDLAELLINAVAVEAAKQEGCTTPSEIIEVLNYLGMDGEAVLTQVTTYVPMVVQFFSGEYLHLYLGPVLGMTVGFNTVTAQ